jgi:hypothetical protein
MKPVTSGDDNSVRIVVTGLAATYPLGGVFWDYIQYVLGFLRLGHDVLYLEDTGKWCYSPTQQTFVEGGEENARFLDQQLRRLDPRLSDRWTYRDSTGEVFGRSREDTLRFCREADLFLHISASCWMREEYYEAGKVAFIDSDPMYTQASVPRYESGNAEPDEIDRIEMLKRHDTFFTFGENVGHEECRIPRGLFDWAPTRQPIVLDCFAPHQVPLSQRRPFLTTVASWEPTESGPVVDGRAYTGKSTEFERFMSLPSRSALPLELAMSGKFPRDRLEQNGWHVIDAYSVSRDPWDYRDYLARSFGEWSVAKNAYAASHSGWFSCRSACYLALGVPVVVQETGFSRVIPCGDGLFAFRTLDEAATAIEDVKSRSLHHRDAAIAIAREYFDSDRVLTQLLEVALNGEPADGSLKNR